MKLNLKEVREAKGISLRRLAIKTEMSQGYLSDLETGVKNNPTIDRICKLAKALDCKPEDLFDCN